MASGKHIAKPIVVDAYVIKSIYAWVDGSVTITFEPDVAGNYGILERRYDREQYALMVSRFTPSPNDYLVIQADGYEYFNPADVFEKKYSPIDAAEAA